MYYILTFCLICYKFPHPLGGLTEVCKKASWTRTSSFIKNISRKKNAGGSEIPDKQPPYKCRSTTQNACCKPAVF